MRPIPLGSEGILDIEVTDEMSAGFDELGEVHRTYATFWMAKHFEEAGRKMLLRFLEPGEDGIGTSVSVEHLAPSPIGAKLRVVARCTGVDDNRVRCECSAHGADGRQVGRGSTGQVVLPAAKIRELLGP